MNNRVFFKPTELRLNKETGNKTRRIVCFKIILMAVTGIAFIAAYFFLVMQSPPVKLIRPKPGAARADIVTQAESFYRQYSQPDSGSRSFEPTITAAIDESLFRYAQFFKKKRGKYPDIAVAYWRVTWGDVAGSDDDHRNNRFAFEIVFDFDGKLIRFNARKRDLKFDKPVILSEDDALVEARYFLETLGVNTESLVIANKDITKTGTDVTSYKFTLKNKINPIPLITETYRFEIVGDRIFGFNKETVFDRKALGWDRIENKRELSIIVMIVIWLAVILFVIVIFVRKLRRDELEFTHAFWLGIITGTLVAILNLTSADGNLLQRIFAGGLTGALTLMAILILYPVAETRSRENWPEKLEVSDLLFHGRARVRETGEGILRSFFISGVTVLLFALLILVITTPGIGYLTFKGTAVGVFQDLPGAVTTVIERITYSILAGLVFLFFWSAYLKSKISNRRVLILLLAVTYNLAGVHTYFFDPPFLSALLVFPITLFWAYAVYRWDLFTIMLSFIWTNVLLKLALVLAVPGVVYSLQGMAALIFLLVVFCLGVYLVFRPGSAKDYEAYVPEYVSRIAEKERFLKELEIARGVQMRFLPQSVPQSSNLEIVSLCQPAMEVGGDYFDFILRNNRYMTVLIGDVSGKGVSAAFYMTMVKGIIKTLSKKTLEPATLLAEANEIFYENAPRDVFITIIYGVFDLEEKILTVASAGHNPLITWKHSTRQLDMVNPRGVALGLAYGEQYNSIIREARIPFEERDLFVFYTDGVSEAMNTQEEIFGEERLKEVIKKHAHLSPQQLQEKIVEAVAQFSGKAPQHDDFTMVVVKVRSQ
jgi:hypothetical protein